MTNTTCTTSRTGKDRKEYHKQWRESHKEALKARNREYCKRHYRKKKNLSDEEITQHKIDRASNARRYIGKENTTQV